MSAQPRSSAGARNEVRAGHSSNPPNSRTVTGPGVIGNIALRLDAEQVCPVKGVKHVAWPLQTLQVMSRAARFSAIIGAFQPLLLGFYSSAPHFSITNSSPWAGTAVLRGQGAREPLLPPSPRSSFWRRFFNKLRMNPFIAHLPSLCS
jgi:hypothetical protein